MQENKKVVAIDSYEMVPPNNEKALQKAVANQPVSVAINANSPAFQHYTSVSIWMEEKERIIKATVLHPELRVHPSYRASSTGCAGCSLTTA